MKITIEIDGMEVASHQVSTAAQPQGEQQRAETSASGLAGVYAKAAATGAIDAGPAPRMKGASMTQGGGQPSPGQAGPQVFIGAGSTDQSGGAAPELTPGSGAY